MGSPSSQSVSPVRVCFRSDGGANIARVSFFDILAMICVHPKDTSNTLLAATHGIQHVGTGFQRTRINAEKRELANERIAHDLKSNGGEFLASPSARA